MNTGDWIIFQYRIVQIKEAKDGRVTSVSDGQFETSGYNLSDRCFPLTLANKNAADYIESYAARVHREGGPGLNYPALHSKAVELAWGIMNLPEEKDAREPAYEAARKFYQVLFEAIRSHSAVEIENIRVFGRG